MTVWYAGMRITADRLNGARASGQVSISATSSITTAIGTYNRGTASVTFPVGLFSSTPSVVVSANSGAPGTEIECSVSSVSASGCTINLARSDTTSTIVYWQAIETTQ